MTVRFSALFALCAVSVVASANPPPRGGPPRQAIDACAQRAANDSCSFTVNDDKVSGVCSPGPRADLPLACKPERSAQPKPPPEPPAEALRACEALESGEVCSFQHDDHDIAGTCASEKDGALACRPSEPPPRR